MNPEVPAAPRVSARWWLFAVTAPLLALPLLLVRYPPVTDLPQHVAQVRLFLEALRQSGGGPYAIQWFTPYALVYALLGGLWALLGPENAGRAGVVVLGLLWAGGVHGLAGRRGRAPEAAVLASLLFFSHITYWGFLSFLMGWPAFLLWLDRTTRPPPRAAWAEASVALGLAALLYTAHALWFAAALAWVGLQAVTRQVPLRRSLWRALGVAPVAVGAAIWYPHLAQRGFTSAPTWVIPPHLRLLPPWWVDAGLGGLRGSLEPAVFVAFALWAGLGLWQHRGRLRAAVDRPLLTCAGLLLLLGLVLPDKYSNTISFAGRWVPPGLALLLLGLPAPELRPLLRRSFAVGLAVAFVGATALRWLEFDAVELEGLRESLARLPPEQRVLGLDFHTRSPIVKGRPFLQTFAYAQVLRGGQVYFSFAEFAPSLVVFAQRREVPWPERLNWYPERIRPRDLGYFDAVLAAGDAQQHAWLVAHGLVPVTPEPTLWRLYRVPPEAKLAAPGNAWSTGGGGTKG